MTRSFPRKSACCSYCGRPITPADNRCPYDLVPNPHYVAKKRATIRAGRKPILAAR